MAADMFLKLDGITGESGDHEYPGSIHVLSFSWGLSQTGAHATGGGAGAGKVNVHDVSITKFVDKSSTSLMLRHDRGKRIPNGMIIVRRKPKPGDKPEYMKIMLIDILVSGLQFAGHDGDGLTENLTLNFAKFMIEGIPDW